MDVGENNPPAKHRLEGLLRGLMAFSPGVFDRADRMFNIVRQVELKNLGPMFAPSYGRVLEIGCGKGYFAKYFVDRGDDYYGIDLESEEVTFFKQRSDHAGTGRMHIVRGSATEMPFEDESFDCVFCNCVIEHIPDDQSVLRESVRVLKQDGDFIYTFPSAVFDPKFLKPFLFKRPGWQWLCDPAHQKYFDHPTIREAEEWYACACWYHERRGYTQEWVHAFLAEIGLEIEDEFFFFTQPLAEVWEWVIFSRLNQLFPYSLLLFTPIMRLLPITKRGTATDSQLIAIKAGRK
jgi:SAM-dependent methyltransferase